VKMATRKRAVAPPPRRPERNSRSSGATAGRRSLRLNPLPWLLQHLQALVESLGRLARTPLATLITVAVLGIALALPAGLHLLLSNARQLGDTWQGAAQISLYLQQAVDGKAGAALAERLGDHRDVAATRYISRGDALEEFRQLSGFGGALDALGENPLPAVVVVQPATVEPARLEALQAELQALPEVELAQLDLAWVQRLYSLMDLGRRAVLGLGALLALGVVLIIGNTIRMAIESRREEIIVIKLVGGTDGFARRPFLYTGFWFGVLGGLVAWLLERLTLWSLEGPVQRVALLYQSSFRLQGPGFDEAVLLLALAALLGLAGAWLAVGRHLRAIEPT